MSAVALNEVIEEKKYYRLSSESEAEEDENSDTSFTLASSHSGTYHDNNNDASLVLKRGRGYFPCIFNMYFLICILLIIKNKLSSSIVIPVHDTVPM